MPDPAGGPSLPAPGAHSLKTPPVSLTMKG